MIAGYMTPIAVCSVCGERLGDYQSADFAPYLVTFVIGLAFGPAVLELSLAGVASPAVTALLVVAALATALVLLPRAKGAAIALLWALDVRTNQ